MRRRRLAQQWQVLSMTPMPAYNDVLEWLTLLTDWLPLLTLLPQPWQFGLRTWQVVLCAGSAHPGDPTLRRCR